MFIFIIWLSKLSVYFMCGLLIVPKRGTKKNLNSDYVTYIFKKNALTDKNFLIFSSYDFHLEIIFRMRHHITLISTWRWFLKSQTMPHYSYMNEDILFSNILSIKKKTNMEDIKMIPIDEKTIDSVRTHTNTFCLSVCLSLSLYIYKHTFINLRSEQG